MFNRPYDLAVIFAIFALVVVTFGFFIDGVNDYYDEDGDTSYFETVESTVTDSTGLKGAADDMSEGITGEEGASEDTSEEGIIIRGFKSVLKLGKTFTGMLDALDEGLTAIGVDPIYLTIVGSTLLIIFGVVLYTWIRGN